MLVTTEAIALSSKKYSESSLIIKALTRSDGVKSYLVRGVRSKKNKGLSPALFQALTILDIEAFHKNKGGLESIRSAKISNPFQTIPYNISKNSITLFISELLNICVKEEGKNDNLFEFIKSSFLWLDMSDNFQNFHLHFITKLLKYLGISPSVNIKETNDFDFINGIFIKSDEKNRVLPKNIVKGFYNFLGTNFDYYEESINSSKKRKEFLEFIMNYLEYHIESFKRPKSLNILYDLFQA